MSQIPSEILDLLLSNKPRRVYHGTAAPENFPVPSMENTRRGLGISVDPDPNIAYTYAKGMDGGRIIPLDILPGAKIASPEEAIEIFKKAGTEELFIKALRELGYAGYLPDYKGHPIIIDQRALRNSISGEQGESDTMFTEQVMRSLK